MQPRADVVPVKQGEAVVFPVRERPCGGQAKYLYSPPPKPRQAIAMPPKHSRC
jgi:hypothetical protein